MICSRYAAPVLALLCVALVPTIIHQYLGLTVEDGRKAGAVGWQLAGLSGRATPRAPGGISAAYQSHDWIERRFSGAEGQVTLFVARSFDAKRLYHHPENTVLHGTTLESSGTRHLPPRPDVPVHVLASSPGSGSDLALYALLYDTQFVENPYVFQARTSWKLLVAPRRPMTLFLVHDASNPPDTPLERTLAIRVLHEAIERFTSQRSSTGP